MRLWSLHPSYLDAKGLVALWREALLAQKVLAGRTRGYRNHPQLRRFKESPKPLAMIGRYLRGIAQEAKKRAYRFDESKIEQKGVRGYIMSLRRGQLDYEWKHLRRKLKVRDPQRYRSALKLRRPKAHPLFKIRPGGIEAWEKVG